MSGLTVNPDGPAKVDHAKVLSVNIREQTIEVGTTFTHKTLTIPYMVPYTHGDHGGGINFMPEKGSHCYVCIPSDETAFVLGFIQNPKNVPTEVRDDDGELISVATDSGPDFSGLRHPLEPGDIMLSATDDNFIILRRGGVLQIGATALAQRVYIPIENTVRDFFQRYQAYSPLGEIEWGHATLTDDDDMSSARSTPVLVKYNIKAKAQEDVTEGKFTVEVRAGTLTNAVLDTDKDSEHLFANENIRQAELPVPLAVSLPPVPPGLSTEFPGIPTDGTGTISITIYSHEEGQEKVTYAFQIDSNGNNFIRTEASIHVEVANTVYAKVDKGVKIDFGDEDPLLPTGSAVELLQSNEFKALVKTMVLQAVQELTISAPIMTIGPGNLTIAANLTGPLSFGVDGAGGTLGDGPSSHRVVIDNGLFAALATHTHDPNNAGLSAILGDLGDNVATLKAEKHEE